MLGGCGGDELEKPTVAQPEPTGTPAAATVAPGATPAVTLRMFRALYDAGNAEACRLVTRSFDAAADGTSCRSAVRAKALDYAIVTLSETGNRATARRAEIKAALRVDEPGDARRGEKVDGSVILRKDGEGWRISQFRG